MKKSPKLDKRVYDEIPERVANALSSRSNENISEIIREALDTERKLFKEDRISKKHKALEKLKIIKSTRPKLRDIDKSDLKKEVKKIAKYYSKEIHGNFNSYLYTFLQNLMPFVLNFWLNSFSIIQVFKNLKGSKELKNRIIIKGNIELINRLEKFGSLVIVPTHVSNFDSLVLGHLIHVAGLRPPLWGAGINLYKGFTVSYIMNNIGCYKVDRRKKNKLYLETLKEYSTYYLERGYNAIFYPGGTRSRSGEIEKRLKLGLLSTVVKAFINNLKAGKSKSNIYVVPVSLSYTIVPEAESLALEHYYGKDKKKQILNKVSRKASLLVRTLKKFWHIISFNNPIYLTFGDPIDPLGNKVNNEGISIDRAGIPINTKSKITDSDGNFIESDKALRKYTATLGKKIAESYTKENTIIPTQVFLYSIVNYLKKAKNNISDEELVRLIPDQNRIPIEKLKIEVQEVIKTLKHKSEDGKLKLHFFIENEKIDLIIKAGIKIYASNYASKAISKDGNSITPNKLATILYYSSRIRCYLSKSGKK